MYNQAPRASPRLPAGKREGNLKVNPSRTNLVNVPQYCPFCGGRRLRRRNSQPGQPWRCSDCGQILRIFRQETGPPSQSSKPVQKKAGIASLFGKWWVWLGMIIFVVFIWNNFVDRTSGVSDSVSLPTPVPAPAPIAAPAPAPIAAPALRHLAEKEYMLKLINYERTQAGLNPVVLGDNIAAQLHAESSLENCASGHWGVDGLKPYMRYSLAGDYQSNSENGLGSNYCITWQDGYRTVGDIELEILEGMQGWMESEGHRENILDPWHKKVNVGLAWNQYNFVAYQHFEGDYVEYAQLPAMDDGVLQLSGRVKNGFAFDTSVDLGVQIFYDPPPHPLTRGQTARTYCYSPGPLVASLREPLTGGWYYEEDEFTASFSSCPDPYALPADTPAPRSNDEDHKLHQQAYAASQNPLEQQLTVPDITATEWTALGADFSVVADLSDVAEQHGAGVYTITVWGNSGGEYVPISNYSIFYNIEPPNTYSPR